MGSFTQEWAGEEEEEDKSPFLFFEQCGKTMVVGDVIHRALLCIPTLPKIQGSVTFFLPGFFCAKF